MTLEKVDQRDKPHQAVRCPDCQGEGGDPSVISQVKRSVESVTVVLGGQTQR